MVPEALDKHPRGGLLHPFVLGRKNGFVVRGGEREACVPNFTKVARDQQLLLATWGVTIDGKPSMLCLWPVVLPPTVLSIAINHRLSTACLRSRLPRPLTTEKGAHSPLCYRACAPGFRPYLHIIMEHYYGGQSQVIPSGLSHGPLHSAGPDNPCTLPSEGAEGGKRDRIIWGPGMARFALGGGIGLGAISNLDATCSGELCGPKQTTPSSHLFLKWGPPQ